MRTRFPIAICCLLCLLTAACNKPNEDATRDTDTAAAALSGDEATPQAEAIDPAAVLGEWTLIQIDDAPPAVSVNLTLTEQEISGGAGCNSFSGRYTLKASGEASAKDLGFTRMFCGGVDGNPSPAFEQERALSAILNEADRVALEGDRMTWSGPRGKLVYQRAAAP